MKKYLYIVLLVFFWSCEDSKEGDTAPTEVTLWGVVYSVEGTDSLELYGYNLTGSIPSEIGNLTNLTYINLFNNNLTGSIPSEIGNLTNLTHLELGGNQLTGSIPPEIGNLTNLTELGLAFNQLSGIIPDELCNQGDSTPYLYWNRLCPPYPSCFEDEPFNDNKIEDQDTSDCN